MKEIARGAEAVLYEAETNGDTRIVKVRPEKKYRIAEIDLELRKRRTKKEASLLKLLSEQGKAVPKLISTDNSSTIEMEKIKGVQVRDILDKDPSVALSIGTNLADLHSLDIVHSDLTTSNMLLCPDCKKVYFIDFGLSYHTTRIEDKAVDIHLFLQALESRHHKVKEQAFKYFLKGYSMYSGKNEVLKRLETVEKRGRHKQK